MGASHSGALNNYVFFQMVEKNMFDTPSFCSEQGAQLYSRYHDDLLLVCSSGQALRSATGLVTSRAQACWRVLVDDTSAHAVPMLDLRVFNSVSEAGETILAHSVYTKSTARMIPLHVTSQHSIHCHRSWPIAEAARMLSRSSSNEAHDEFPG